MKTRLVALAVIALLIAVVAPAGAARQKSAKPRWSRDMCATQSGHRFTTTTQGDAGVYIAEPATGKPLLTADQAYANFVKLYGKQKPGERRRTLVRYGLISTGELQFASASLLERAWQVRRTPGWMISNCAAPTHPLAYYGLPNHPGKPGVLFFSVADTTDATSLGWSYEYKARNGTTYGTSGSGVVIDPDEGSPPVASTRYASVPWKLVKRGAHDRRLLLRYHPLPCYSLDHLNVDQNADGKGHDLISVILSTGPDGTCAAPSASAPFITAYSVDERFGKLRHRRTGRTHFAPIGSSPGEGPSARS